MYYLSGLTFKSLKIFVTIWVLIAFISPPSTHGNPITKRQFLKVVKLLEDSIQTEIPSDDADQYSDILFQELYEKKNLTYYHAGDKTLPVFISNGCGHIGANIHVLLRGEDYINPKDQNDFVVLKKVGSPEGAYSVHRAYIMDVDKLSKLSKVIWNDGRIEQQKNIKPLINQLGNTEVQARALRAHRPLCDWIGYSLLCNSKVNVPPARERKDPEPLDEEDEDPVHLPGIDEENAEGGGGEAGGAEAGGDFGAEAAAAKQKRFIGAGGSKELDKGAIKRKVGNELLESGEEGSEGEEEKTMPGVKDMGPTTTTTTTTTTSTSTTTPKTRSTTTTRRVIERKQETTTVPSSTTPSDEGEKQEEQGTKKKHKRKHKSKKKNSETNKEI